MSVVSFERHCFVLYDSGLTKNFKNCIYMVLPQTGISSIYI